MEEESVGDGIADRYDIKDQKLVKNGFLQGIQMVFQLWSQLNIVCESNF